MINVRAGLFVVGSVAFFAAVAACSGGGGGGNSAIPCCSAQGQTEAPPPSFAGAVGSAASAGRFAQPIAFLTSGADATCVLPTLNGIELPPFEDLGKSVRVEADGTYLVEIKRAGAGRRVMVRVFDRDSDGETNLGVAALAAFPVDDDEAPPIPVSPIRFGAAGKMGESTLELALYCVMSKAAAGSGNDLQNLSFSDVRALVTSSFASAFTGMNDLGDAAVHAGRYRHAVNGLVNLDPANTGALATLRESADALVDACRSPNPPAGLECTSGDGRAEFYRYWFLARRGDDADFSLSVALPRGLGDHLQALAQDMSDAISDQYGGNPLPAGRTIELYKENHRLRVEIAAAAIERAASCFGDAPDADGDGICEGGTVDVDQAVDTGRGARSIRGLLEEVRTAIIAAPDELAIESAWQAVSEDIIQNFGVQSALQAVPDNNDFLDNIFFAARDGHQPAAQFAIVTTASHLEIAQTLFDGGGSSGVRENIAIDVATNFSVLPLADQARVADVVFYATANGTDLTL